MTKILEVAMEVKVKLSVACSRFVSKCLVLLLFLFTAYFIQFSSVA